MKVIILGSGRQGARLAQLLEAEKYEVIVIDKNPSAFNRLENFHGKLVLGSGIDEDVMIRAGIKDAYAFAAVTNGDNTNLMAAQIAKVIYKVPKVVCRIYDPRRSGIYHDLGLETVCATTVGARMLRNVITSPKVLRQYQMGDGTAVAIELKLGEKIQNKKVKDIEIPGKFRISAVTREYKPIVVNDDFELKPGDQVFGVMATEDIEKLKEIFDVNEYAVNYPLKGGY